MEYIYQIKNLKNKKIYIGKTSNPEKRKKQHFLDLKRNNHANIFLQEDYNKYGIENFKFEILESNINSELSSAIEEYYIKNTDNTYNILFGDNNQSKSKKFTEEEIFVIILFSLEFSRMGQVLADTFETNRGRISKIKNDKKLNNYHQFIKNLSVEDRKKYIDKFDNKYNILSQKKKTTILKGKRKLTKQQVFTVLFNEEKGRIIPLKRLAKFWEVSSYTLDCILMGKSYQDYFDEYKNINETEKSNVASFLREEEEKIARTAGNSLRQPNKKLNRKTLIDC